MVSVVMQGTAGRLVLVGTTCSDRACEAGEEDVEDVDYDNDYGDRTIILLVMMSNNYDNND